MHFVKKSEARQETEDENVILEAVKSATPNAVEEEDKSDITKKMNDLSISKHKDESPKVSQLKIILNTPRGVESLIVYKETPAEVASKICSLGGIEKNERLEEAIAYYINKSLSPLKASQQPQFQQYYNNQQSYYLNPNIPPTGVFYPPPPY